VEEERTHMHGRLIEGEHIAQSVAMCYKYIIEMYLKEKAVEESEETPSDRNLCES